MRPAAVAASITVPTWPAPSVAPARPASCWTRTAGAAPVSTSPQGCCPEHRAPDFSAPAFLAGRPSPQPCPHCGTRQGGSGGIRGRSDRHLQSGQSGPAAGLLSKRRDRDTQMNGTKYFNIIPLKSLGHHLKVNQGSNLIKCKKKPLELWFQMHLRSNPGFIIFFNKIYLSLIIYIL